MSKEDNTPTFSPPEVEKFKALQSTLFTANKGEHMLDTGQNAPVIRKHSDGSETRSTLTWKTVFDMRNAAFNLYYDNFYGNERLQSAANDIVEKEKEKAQKRRQETQTQIRELNTIWELHPDQDPDDEERTVR